MSLKRVLTTGVATVALAAATVTPFAAAQAESWNGNGHGKGFYRSEHRDWKGGQRFGYRHDGYRKDKSDKKVARGIAIGLGVLLLGTILAAEADRHDYHGGRY